MASTAKQIRDLIVPMLESMQVVVDGDPQDLFQEVFPFAQGSYEGFPVAIIRATGGSGETIDTHRIERTFTFDIQFLQVISDQGKDKEQANAIMLAACDLMVTMFDQDPTLANEVLKINVISFTYDFEQLTGSQVFATFQIEARVVVPNYS